MSLGTLDWYQREYEDLRESFQQKVRDEEKQKSKDTNELAGIFREMSDVVSPFSYLLKDSKEKIEF